MPVPIDPAVTALVGVAIGGVIGVVGTVLTALATSGRERKAFLRSASQQHSDRVRSTYEHALNVLFNLNGGGSPDRTTYGNLVAQMALFGSPEVNRLLDAYLVLPLEGRQADLTAFTVAMKRHLENLDNVTR